MLKNQLYRLLSHICLGNKKNEYRQRYKDMLRKSYSQIPAKKSFAQFGEDILLETCFNLLFSTDISKIKYLDIGSNDPIIGNNTYFFYKNKASGVLI